ncbi:MAG TPA: DegV family protein [Candidatus Aphodovivens avicola]|nr:DegV family protein [Candidatus Aphodovivens avicola]
MDFEIVTDSCCNLLEDMIDDFGIHVLPLTFMVDGEDEVYQSYLKGERTDLKQFYTMMREGKVFKTSLPNLAESEALFRELLGSGRDVLYIAFSSGLSGTYQALSLMAAQLQEEFPERKIHVVDSLAASGGQGLLVWYAVQHARAGESIDQVRDWLEENKLHLAHWFTVDDLMFLFRGGRVSKTAAWAGTLLNIKPVLHVDDEGHLIPMEKVRGRKKSLNALIDHMEKSANKPISDQMVFITHGDCIEDAEYVAAKIKERFGVKEVVINYVDPVIGAHSGPGTMALFFLADKR